MEQMTLGVDLRDEGERLALRAKQGWHALADAWFATVRIGETFTADSLIEAVGLPADSATNANNAVGAFIGSLARSKPALVRAIGYDTSKRAESHARVVRVWQKL